MGNLFNLNAGLAQDIVNLQGHDRPTLAADLYAALGASKCRLYIIPSQNMVVLRQGDSEADRYQDHAFLSLLLTGE